MGHFVLKHVTNTDLLSHHVKYRLTTLHKRGEGGGEVLLKKYQLMQTNRIYHNIVNIK